MEEKLKVAIVGAGNISERHVRGWLASGKAEICAVVDIMPERAEEKAAKWGSTGGYFTSLDDMLRRIEPDLADVCTREYAHEGPALEALSSGINVLCEKVMSNTLESGYRMVSVSRGCGLWTGVNYNYHFFPGVIKLKEVISSGEFGRPLLAQCTCHSFCFHHLLELMIHLFGPIREVWARGTGREWPQEFYDLYRISDEMIYVPGSSFVSVIEFESGVRGSLASTLKTGLDAMPFMITVFFDSGSSLQLRDLDWLHDMAGRLLILGEDRDLLKGGEAWDRRDSMISFYGATSAAAESILSGGSPETDWERGWDVMLADHAMVVSEREGRPVDFHLLKGEIESEMGRCMGTEKQGC